MQLVKSRLPERNEIAPVFAACVVLVFSWSLIWFFQKMPEWLPYLGIAELAGILAYTQAFALFESIVVFLPWLALAMVLPRHWLAERFAARGGAIVLVLAFWTALFQLIFTSVIVFWTARDFALWFGLALLSIALAYTAVSVSERAARILAGLLDRTTIFLYIYVPLGILGVAVIAVKNLF